jgi:hypothetical protein
MEESRVPKVPIYCSSTIKRLSQTLSAYQQQRWSSVYAQVYERDDLLDNVIGGYSRLARSVASPSASHWLAMTSCCILIYCLTSIGSTDRYRSLLGKELCILFALCKVACQRSE